MVLIATFMPTYAGFTAFRTLQGFFATSPQVIGLSVVSKPLSSTQDHEFANGGILQDHLNLRRDRNGLHNGHLFWKARVD